MLWIRNLEEVSKATATTVLSVVLGSEVHIDGVLYYEGGVIKCGLLAQERRSSGLYK